MHLETCPSRFDSVLFSTPFCIAFVWTLSLLENLRNFVTPSVVKNEIYAFIFNYACFFGSSKKTPQNPDLKLPHPYQKSLSTAWVTSDKLPLGKLQSPLQSNCIFTVSWQTSGFIYFLFFLSCFLSLMLWLWWRHQFHYHTSWI